MEQIIIQRLAMEKLGIKLSPDQIKEILKKIGPLLTLAACNTVDEFARRIDYLPQSSEFEQFVALVTNNETYFFREPHHFTFLGEKLIGPHLANYKEKACFKIMSLGCANGAEPYSIAMTMYDFLKKFHAWTCEIRALDVNPYNLQVAKQASYGSHSFRQPLLDAIYQQRFFTKAGNHWLLNPEIRAMVQFEISNLTQDQFGKGWEGLTDVVFFRNVFMYFDESSRMKVFARVAELLSNNGYCIVASQEVSSVPQALFKSLHTKSGFVFLKNNRKEETAVLLKDKKVKEKKKGEVSFQHIAKSLSARKNATGAATIKEQVLNSSHPPLILAKVKLTEAIECFDREEFTKARVLLDEIIKLEIEDPYFWFLKAHLDLNDNKIIVAWEAVMQAIQKDPLLPEGYFVLGLIHKSKEDMKEAEEMFQKALFLAPGFWPARVFLGEVFRKQGKKTSALEEYKTALTARVVKSVSPLYLERWSNTVGNIARNAITMLEREKAKDAK